MTLATSVCSSAETFLRKTEPAASAAIESERAGQLSGTFDGNHVSAVFCVFLGFACSPPHSLLLLSTRRIAVQAKHWLLRQSARASWRCCPRKFDLARDFIERHVHPFVWDPVLVDLLRLPQWLVFGVIGGLAIRLGGKPAPKFGFSSR